jgi:hypothetical protein
MKRLGPSLAAAVLFVCGAISPIVSPCFAQQQKPPKPPPPAKPATGKPNGGGKPGAPGRGPQVNAAKELDQFAKMSPKEREKELSKLPPQRRAAFEQRLARYQQMTPEQQEKFRQTLESMESLPKDRQNAVKQEIQRISALPFEQRKKILSSEDFRQRFSPDEQKLVLGRFPGVQKQLDEQHH